MCSTRKWRLEITDEVWRAARLKHAAIDSVLGELRADAHQRCIGRRLGRAERYLEV